SKDCATLDFSRRLRMAEKQRTPFPAFSNISAIRRVWPRLDRLWPIRGGALASKRNGRTPRRCRRSGQPRQRLFQIHVCATEEGGLPMRTLGIFTFAAALMIGSAAHAQTIDWKKVDAALGRTAAVTGDVHRYGFPRSDLHVTLDGVTIKPGLALGGWAAFKPV